MANCVSHANVEKNPVNMKNHTIVIKETILIE